MFLSLEKDKNDLENTIELGNPSILLFKKFLILFISSLDIFDPLYNILLFDKGNDFNLTPSYNILIKDKYLSLLFNPKSLFKFYEN